MSRRAIWKGVVSFGPINVPVKLYSAVEDKAVHFHLLHDADNVRLQQRMVCSLEDLPIAREHHRKGYEVEDGQFVVVSDEELEALEPESSRIIEILDFVPADQVDGRYYDRGYHLGSDGNEGAYRRLSETLADVPRVGICQWVMRRRAYLGVLRRSGPVISLVTMRYADEVTPVSQLALPPAEATKKELELAGYLVDEMTEPWNPSDWTNDFQERLMKLVQRKAHGEKPPRRRPVRPRASEPSELETLLSRSLQRARSKEGRRG